MRAAAAQMLGELGFSVSEARSSEEALALLRGGLVPDLVVTDHLMPGMTGTALAQVLRTERPGLPVLLVSGYAEDGALPSDLPRLNKPFRQADLAQALSILLPR